MGIFSISQIRKKTQCFSNSKHTLKTSITTSHLILPLMIALSVSFLSLQKSHAVDLTEQKTASLIENYVKEQIRRDNDWPFKLMINTTNLTDLVIDDLASESPQVLIGQQSRVARLWDILTRSTGRVPVLVGPVGVGKSALLNEFVAQVLKKEIPSDLHWEELENTIFLQMSARPFMPGGPLDFNVALRILTQMSKDLDRKFVLVINDVSFMSEYNYSVLRENASRPGHIPVILESNLKEHANSVLKNQNLQRYLDILLLETPKPEEIKSIINSGYAKRISTRTGVTLGDVVIDAVIDAAADYRADLADPARAMQLLEDFAIYQQRASETAPPTPTDVFRFVARKLDLPVIPQNEEEFKKYMDDLRAELKSEVISQDHLVDGLVGQFILALTSKEKKHQSAVISGPTGVGKTLVAELLGKKFFGADDRILEIDMTEFTDAKSARWALFGATNGFLSSDENKGVMCEYLDGAGMNGGIIVLNELEEAPSEVQTILMELLDKGEIRGGDGRIRRLNRHLIIATSNKRSENILPEQRLKTMTARELDKFVQSISEEQLKKSWTEKESFTESDSNVVKTAVPERIDRFYFARPLLIEDAVLVGQLEVAKWVSEFTKKGKGEVEVDSNFAGSLIPAFYDQTLGARQIKRKIGYYLEKAVEMHRATYPESTAKKFYISAAIHPSQLTTSFVKIKSDGPDAEITLDGPKIPVSNLLLDPEVRAKIQNLNKELEKDIFGQPEAIEAIVSAVKARYLNPDNKKATNGTLIGTTGTGKTQIAKALAKALFGREDAFELFEMGKVKNVESLGSIFSPSPPFLGADQPGQFEKFLQANPDGAVGVFDEFSNAGGNNPEQKAAILKEFYTMIDEGYFYSTVTKKRYDLRKYFFLFTGNDGEHIFKGGQSDEILMDQWSSVTKKKNGPQQILENAGVPQAFLGRNWFIVLMRPAVKEVKVKIAEKLLNEWRTQVSAAQPIDIEFSENFVEEVGLLTFSSDRGARSIHDFINGPLAKMVGEEVITHLKWEELLENGRRAKVKLNIEVKKPTVPFYFGDKPEKFEAKVLLTLEQEGGKSINAEVDFSKLASFMPQVFVDSAWVTAIHEMGHAVVAFTEVTGKKVKKITIIPESLPSGTQAAGYTSFEATPTKGEANWGWLIRNLAGLLAGSEAERLYGEERNTGRSSDISRAGEMARQVIVDHHLISELDATKAYLDKEGKYHDNLPEKEKRLIEKHVNRAISEARALAIKKLKEEWHIVIAGARFLLEHGSMNEEEFQRLVAKGVQAREKATKVKRALVKMGFSNAADAYPLSNESVADPGHKSGVDQSLIPEYKSKKKKGLCAELLASVRS